MWNVNEVINENHRNIEEYYEDKTKEAYKRIGGIIRSYWICKNGISKAMIMEYYKLVASIGKKEESGKNAYFILGYFYQYEYFSKNGKLNYLKAKKH